MSSQGKIQILEAMLSNVRPKARYMSQMHVEEFTDEIVKQIINGDVEIPQQKQQIEQINKKKDFQSQIRNRFISKAEKERISLQHKLSYLATSINALKNYDTVLNRSKKSSQIDQLTESKMKQQLKQRQRDWRGEIARRSKQLKQRKQKMEEIHKKKQQQLRELEQKLKNEQSEKKKQQIIEHINNIKERMQKRQIDIKDSNQKLKQVLHKKKLYDKFNQAFLQRENSELQERKKKLAEIRNLHKPIDTSQLFEHQQKLLEIKKQKQEIREREKRMNQSRSRTYKVPYESAYYKKISANQQQHQSYERIKMDKMKQFSDHVKQHFAPQIDQEKRKMLEEIREKEEEKIRLREQRQKQLLEKPKLKGLQYLQLIKKLPKKRENSASPETRQAKTERSYPNYLNRSVNLHQKPWKTILKSNLDKQEKATRLYYQSEKIQESLKRKQQYNRLLKAKDDGQIDQQYYQMIKAKLNLLQGSN